MIQEWVDREGQAGHSRAGTAPMGAAQTCRETPAEVLETSWRISNLFSFFFLAFYFIFKALGAASKRVWECWAEPASPQSVQVQTDALIPP